MRPSISPPIATYLIPSRATSNILQGQCRKGGRWPCRPSPPYLVSDGSKASIIGRRAASSGNHHKLAGHEPPTNQETVKLVLRGIYRSIGTARAGKPAATANIVRPMLEACPENTLIGLRDRALLSFGLASAMRRNERERIDRLVREFTEIRRPTPRRR
jgi:hypothetical protein